MLKSHTERPLASDETEEVSTFAKDGRKTLKLGLLARDPARVMKAIDVCVNSSQRAMLHGSLTLSENDCTALSLQLGCLWGQQLVKAFGWEWLCLMQNDIEQYCVAAKDRALVVYPTYFVRDCLREPRVDCTAMLAFNMLVAKRFDHAPVGGYLDVLENVVRIVPR